MWVDYKPIHKSQLYFDVNKRATFGFDRLLQEQLWVVPTTPISSPLRSRRPRIGMCRLALGSMRDYTLVIFYIAIENRHFEEAHQLEMGYVE